MSLLFGIDVPLFDNTTGAPLAFGTVYFGEPNTDAKTNPKTPYTDNTYGTPLAATQSLTSAGKFQQEIWLDGGYSIIIDDADGVQIAEFPLIPESTVAASVAWGDITGTLSSQTDLQAVLDSKQDTLTAGYGVDISSDTVSSDFATGSASASYTLDADDDNAWLEITGSASVNITCPPESAVNLGARFIHVITNMGPGTVTIVAGSGVTVHPPPDGTLVVPQYATVGIKKLSSASDTYVVFGPTEAA